MAMLKKYWLAQTMNVNPQLGAAAQEPVHRLISSIQSGRTWKGQITALRHDLMDFMSYYKVYPVSFPDEERSLHCEEREQYNDMVVLPARLRTIHLPRKDGSLTSAMKRSRRLVNN